MPPFKRRLFPRLLADCVEPLTKPVFRRHGLVTTQLIREWERIVGSELARHAVPLKLSFPRRDAQADGILTVGASSGSATELQHSEPVILERLATYFGYRAVVRIQIRQVAPAADTRRIPALPPTDARTSLPVAVTDDALRHALERLAAALQKSPG